MNRIKNLKNKKGFTLVELVVVIVIIAILAAALVTSLVGYIEKANGTNALLEANNVYVAAEAYASEQVGTAAKSNTTIEDEIDTASAAGNLIYEVNNYLGKDVIGTAYAAGTGAITSMTVNAKGTITAFAYTASNGRTVSFNGTSWTVG